MCVSICQTVSDIMDFLAIEMISTTTGFTVQRIIHLQRRWRRWMRTYQTRLVHLCISLAHLSLDNRTSGYSMGLHWAFAKACLNRR